MLIMLNLLDLKDQIIRSFSIVSIFIARLVGIKYRIAWFAGSRLRASVLCVANMRNFVRSGITGTVRTVATGVWSALLARVLMF